VTIDVYYKVQIKKVVEKGNGKGHACFEKNSQKKKRSRRVKELKGCKEFWDKD
jgi:hypothetical protein